MEIVNLVEYDGQTYQNMIFTLDERFIFEKIAGDKALVLSKEEFVRKGKLPIFKKYEQDIAK